MYMQAVEFQAVVKEGVIQIPDEYKQEIGEDDEVKIIILFSCRKQKAWKIMDELAKNPINVKGLQKLTRDEIHDRKL
jgi:hypothetical protein